MQQNGVTTKMSVHIRGQRGALLAESAAALVVLTMILVAATVILIWVGSFMIYKIKVGFIANQAAQYAAGTLSWNSNYNPNPSSALGGYQTPPQKVNSVVQAMCTPAGLPASSLTGSTTATITDNGATVTCTVTMNTLTPMPVRIQDTAAASLMTYQPPALLFLYPQSTSSYEMVIPCYGLQSSMVLLNTPAYQLYSSLPGTADITVMSF